MKITIDMRKILDSGVGTYIQNLIPRVIARLPEHHFILLGPHNDLIQHFGGYSHVTMLDYHTRPYSLREQIDLLPLIPNDTDLLWVPFINIPIFYRGKLLVTVYDVNFLALPHFLNWSQRLYAKAIFNAIRYKAEHVFCISEFSKQEFLRLVPGQRDNVSAILLGTAPQWFKPLHNLENPQSQPFFLFVGNVKPHKNLIRLLQAFEKIANQIPHNLVIVGKKEGFIVSDKAALAYPSALKERILFTGYIDDDQLRQYYAHATALAFPSLYEGFGLPALEAMACGCPVLTSNITALPEVCGDAALYCDPYSVDDIAQQLLRLATDEGLRQELMVKGKTRAAHMTFETCANETVKMIRNLLA
jgi:glycosyltransferase involved in cell wall biosynthesis